MNSLLYKIFELAANASLAFRSFVAQYDWLKLTNNNIYWGDFCIRLCRDTKPERLA